MEKVFCNKCRHLITSNKSGMICNAFSNQKIKSEDWFEQQVVYIQHPSEKNKNMDCPDYVREKGEVK